MGNRKMINNNNTKVSLLILGCIFAACARVPVTDFADEYASIPETDFADEHASIPETDFADEHASISSAEGIGTSLHLRGPNPTYSIIAHRVNSVGSMNLLKRHPGANSVEMDVAWVQSGGYSRGWYACHGDSAPGVKVPCSTVAGLETTKSILMTLPTSIKMVWMDIKTGKTERQVHTNQWMSTQLVDTLLSIPRIRSGDVAVILGYNSANDSYTQIFKYLADAINGLNSLKKKLPWLIDVWCGDKNSISRANIECARKDVMCTISMGTSLIGQTHGVAGGKLSNWMKLGIWAKKRSNIVKTWLWTLPAGPAAQASTGYVDDLIRLGSQGKNYWEYLVGYNWACGAQFDGFVVGPFYDIFRGCGVGCSYMKREMAKARRSMANTATDFYRRYVDTAHASHHCTCSSNGDMCGSTQRNGVYRRRPN